MRQYTKRNRVTTFDFVVWIGLFIIGFLFIYYLLSRSDVSNFTVEILAVTIGVVLVVVSVGVTIHIQTQYELEREFQVKIYETKLDLYTKLLAQIAQMDDDDEIKDCELEGIRNSARQLSLLADNKVLLHLACFLWILENTQIERNVAIDKIDDADELRNDFGSQLSGEVIQELLDDDDLQGTWQKIWRVLRRSSDPTATLDAATGTLRKIIAAMRKDLQVLQTDESAMTFEKIVLTLVDKGVTAKGE